MRKGWKVASKPHALGRLSGSVRAIDEVFAASLSCKKGMCEQIRPLG